MLLNFRTKYTTMSENIFLSTRQKDLQNPQNFIEPEQLCNTVFTAVGGEIFVFLGVEGVLGVYVSCEAGGTVLGRV